MRNQSRCTRRPEPYEHEEYAHTRQQSDPADGSGHQCSLPRFERRREPGGLFHRRGLLLDTFLLVECHRLSFAEMGDSDDVRLAILHPPDIINERSRQASRQAKKGATFRSGRS